MATRDLPGSGTIKLSQVKAEFGKGNNLLSYLGEGGVTSSAPLKLTDFYGKSAGPTPPELIGGNGYFWQANNKSMSHSHTFSVAVSAGDTVVLGVSYGNASSVHPVTCTVNGSATIATRNFQNSQTGLSGGTLNYLVVSSSASTVKVDVTCTREMYRTAIYMFPIKGSFVKSGTSNTTTKYHGTNNAGKVRVNSYPYTNEITADEFSFVVTLNASNSNFTSQWFDYMYAWSDGSKDWDYLEKSTAQASNHCQGGLKILPANFEINYCINGGTNPNGGNATSVFLAQKFIPATSRLSPLEIMKEQFAREEQERLMMEAESCD